MADITEVSIEELLKQKRNIAQIPTEELARQRQLIVVGRPERPESPFQTSPLSIAERARFSFGDKRGKTEILREKFPGSKITEKAGDFFVDGRAVDPAVGRNPFEENLADLVELSPEILRVGGGILGFVGGAGPASIPLAGLGAAGGEAINQIIGRAIGARREAGFKGFKEAGKDIAFVGLTEAAAQGAGIGLTKLFRGMSKRLVEPVFRRSLAVVSDVPEQAIKEVQQQGAERIFTKENLKPRRVLNLGRKIKRVLLKTNKAKGDLVVEARRGLGKTRIRIDDVANDFNLGLLDANIIDIEGKPRAIIVFTKAGKVRKFETIGPNTARNRLIKINNTLKKADRITQSDALALREQLDTLIKSGNKGQITIGTQENALITRLRSQLGDKINRSSNALATANKEFSEFRGTLDNASDIFGDFKDKTLENNFKNIFKESAPQVKLEALENIERLLPPGDIFLDELKQALTANVFLPTTAPRTPAGISIRSLTGISPRSARGLLAGQRRISRFGGRPLSIIGKGIARPPAGPLLRREITERAAQRSLRQPAEIQAQPQIRQPIER